MTPLLFVVLSLAQPGSQSAWTETWTPSGDTPLNLARTVDETLHRLANTDLNFKYQYSTAANRGGFMADCKIASHKTFRLEYPLVGNTEAEGLRRVILVADGRRMLKLVTRGDKPVATPIPAARPLPPDLMKDWFKNDLADAFTAIGSDTNPFEALVKVASNPNSGLVVKAEHRRFAFQNHEIRDQRIVISRRADREKREGSLLYEIVISDRGRVPVSMTNVLKVGKMMFGTRWSADWHFLRGDKGETLDPKSFDISQVH